MTEAIPWLPSSALGDVRTVEPIAQALAEWSTEWLAADRLTVPARWKIGGAGEAIGHMPAHQGNGYRLLPGVDTTLDLAGLLLGRELGERDCRTRHDRAVIDHLVQVALASLTETLGDVLNVPGDRNDGERFILPIYAAGGTPLLHLEATRRVLVALSAIWAGDPRPTAPLPARRSALASQPLSLAARIGASRLALAEIDALGIGDVLTLDTPVSAAVVACLNGESTGDAALSLALGEGNLSLQIERPVSQW